MNKREIIAYAITHAPPGVKGGPYEGAGALGLTAPTLALAYRYRNTKDASPDAAWLRNNGYTARVIRIVRARPSPSEASAVDVLRELVAWDEGTLGRRANADDIFARARCVLAASGPDPMPVVRAAMEWRYGRRGDTGPMNTLAEAVETYRKDGGE